MVLGAMVLWVGLGSVTAGEYLRPFGAKAFDQPALDAGGFGDKKGFAREDGGLRVTLKPGEPEIGWKTPQQLRIGGDCLVVATVEIRKLPKPGQDDGVAIGLALATQNVDQPDATLLRVVEPDGREVFRTVEKAGAGGGMDPMAMMMNRRMMMMNGMGGGAPAKPPKPPRNVFPARGGSIRLEFRRQGPTVRYQVYDEVSPLPREIGQFKIGPADIAGIKLFASNRNGAEPVDVLFRDLKIQADRLTGLGTAVRTVFGTTIHGEPTAIDGPLLLIGAGGPGGPGGPGGGNPGMIQQADAGEMVVPQEVVVETGAEVEAVAIEDGIDDGTGAEPPLDAPAATDIGEVTVTLAEPAQVPAQTTIEIKTEVTTIKAAEAKPGDAKPGDAKPGDAKPGDAKPGDAKPGDAKPGDAKPGDAKPAGGPNPPPKPTPPPPKARVPLDELESITFERASVPSGRFLGQPNVDTTGPGGKDAPAGSKVEEKKPNGAVEDFTAPPPGTVVPPKIARVEAKPNGIRDLHLGLAGLRPAAITQIMIQCPTDKGQASWQIDTTGSENWPLVVRRNGQETWADVFLEPPAGDLNDKQFQVNLTYADNQNANFQIKATGHTDPKLAFDPEAPAPPLDARVFLAGDDQLYGRLEAITEEAATLQLPWGDKLDVPLARVVAVYFGMSDHKETPESFARRVKERGAEDVLLARAKDGEVVAIGGVVEKAQGNKLAFNYQGRSRSLPLKQVEGFILAARPEPKDPDGVRMTFALTGGIVLSGKWTAIEAPNWKVETAWGQTVKIPATDVRTVRSRGGQMTYLSDMTPSQVEENAYFGRRLPFRRDVSLSGEPLRIDGQAIDKGIAVHAQSALTFDLNRQFTLFETRVGFDDAGRKKGRVDCRIFADGKEIYANPDLRADQDPIRLSLPVAGAEQLKLVVDFGPDEDTGDRVIWAEARLFRRTTPAELPPLPKPADPSPAEKPKADPNPAQPGTTPPSGATPNPAPKPASEPAPAVPAVPGNPIAAPPPPIAPKPGSTL